jgi:nitrogen regulatory protein P-II 1
MMLITAVVEPSRVDQIEAALRLFEVRGLTMSEVQVSSRAGRVEVYRGRRWVATMVPRVRLEILAGDDDTNDLVRVILRAAGGGDGYLWVSRVDYLIPIRTGDTGLPGL